MKGTNVLSICGSIYLNGNIVPFVRTVLENASNPDEIEFVVVDDESGSDLMAQSFDAIRKMTPRLTLMEVPKEERLAYFRRCVDFYEREAIFSPEKIAEFRERLALYEDRKIARIWFPTSRNFNRAVEASTGDVVFVTPLDLLVPFDLSKVYEKFKEAKAAREHLCLQFGLDCGNRVRHHGSRIFNRGVYEALKRTDPRFSQEQFSFDERWFVVSVYEDEWNERARKIGGISKGWEEVFREPMVMTMIDSPWFPEYLCRNMLSDFSYFIERITQYLLREAK